MQLSAFSWGSLLHELSCFESYKSFLSNLCQSAFTCSKLTIKITELTTKIPEWRQWRRFGIFIVNSEHVIAGWVCPSLGKWHAELFDRNWKTKLSMELFIAEIFLTDLRRLFNGEKKKQSRLNQLCISYFSCLENCQRISIRHKNVSNN